MREAYQCRINLNAEQEVKFAENAGCSRWVYNRYLHQQMERSKQDLPLLSYQKCLEDLYQQIDQQVWLQSVDIQMLRFSLEYLMETYEQYLKDRLVTSKISCPSFQRKKDYPRFYFTCIQEGDLQQLKKELTVGNIGKVAIDIEKIPKEEVDRVMLIERQRGKYAISFDYRKSVFRKYLCLSQEICAEESLTHIKKTTARLQKMRRRLLRKHIDSQNYMKEAAKIKKLERHIQCQKRDLLHKESKEWVQKNDVIIVERTKVKQAHPIISDRDRKEFLRQLKYKSSRREAQVIILDKSKSSS